MLAADYPVRTLDRRQSDLARRLRALEQENADLRRRLAELTQEVSRMRRAPNYSAERPGI